jgi:hypothetical protein
MVQLLLELVGLVHKDEEKVVQKISATVIGEGIHSTFWGH